MLKELLITGGVAIIIILLLLIIVLMGAKCLQYEKILKLLYRKTLLGVGDEDIKVNRYSFSNQEDKVKYHEGARDTHKLLSNEILELARLENIKLYADLKEEQ